MPDAAASARQAIAMSVNKKTYPFLTESCLLTFGIPSVSDEEIAREWEKAGVCDAPLCWMENGEIITGNIERYIPFRASSPAYRFSSASLDRALKEKLSGALTASAAMEVCRRLSVPCAVSCGIGGIYGAADGEKCADLSMIKNSGVVLICTSPKDMQDLEATVGWLLRNGVRAVGDGCCVCNGYLFEGRPVRLSGTLDAADLRPPLLILRGIAKEKRIKDPEILKRAVCEAREAERSGGYFHPAANAALDKLSGGYSSRLQLYSLLDNISLAAKLFV